MFREIVKEAYRKAYNEYILDSTDVERGMELLKVRAWCHKRYPSVKWNLVSA